MASVAKPEPVAARSSRGPQKSRRDAVEATLKELEERRKKSNKRRRSRCASRRPACPGRSGNSSSSRPCIGLAMFVVGFIVWYGPCSPRPCSALPAPSACRAGCCRSSRSGARRNFCNDFPDAVDVIVRGIKAGLPLLDCMKMITMESPEPVKSEFRADRRDAGDRHAARRGLRQALRAHAAAGSELLRHRRRDPAEGRRQSVGSARQPVARAARPQEDEGEDPGDVDGGEGLRRHHRLRCRSR